MRIFITVLLLIFNLQSLSKANDIRDFQIEGMSVGDSLLDYFSESQIKNESWNWHKKDETWKQFQPIRSYNDYDYVMFTFLGKDKNYTIEEVAGRKVLAIEDCKKLQLEMIDDIEELMPDSKKTEITTNQYRGDASGKSTKTYINIFPVEGFIHIGCYDFSDKFGKENNYLDSLNVSVGSQNFLRFQRSTAF